MNEVGEERVRGFEGVKDGGIGRTVMREVEVMHAPGSSTVA